MRNCTSRQRRTESLYPCLSTRLLVPVEHVTQIHDRFYDSVICYFEFRAPDLDVAPERRQNLATRPDA